MYQMVLGGIDTFLRHCPYPNPIQVLTFAAAYQSVASHLGFGDHQVCVHVVGRDRSLHRVLCFQIDIRRSTKLGGQVLIIRTHEPSTSGGVQLPCELWIFLSCKLGFGTKVSGEIDAPGEGAGAEGDMGCCKLLL